MWSVKNAAVLASSALVSIVIFYTHISRAEGENANRTEWVVLVSNQADTLGADVFVNGSCVGKMLTPNNSEYSRVGPHIRLSLEPGVYVFRIEHINYAPF